MPPTKVDRRHIKHGYLDKIAGFIKLDGLLSVTPISIVNVFICKENNFYFMMKGGKYARKRWNSSGWKRNRIRIGLWSGKRPNGRLRGRAGRGVCLSKVRNKDFTYSRTTLQSDELPEMWY
jgi:hypothetical protein